MVLKADQGDDNADQHKLSIADGGTLTLGSKISGSFVTYLTHTPNATVADSTLAVAGNLTVGGNLTLGSGAELSEAELEMLDGLTGGTVTASKAVVVDANKDIASFRNITLTGELDAGSLDVSGDADIDGTLEADAMTLNGAAITTTATLSTGVSNGNVLVATSGIADNDFLKVDGTSIEGRSSSEVLSDIGGQAALTFGISDTNIPIFTSGVADDDFLRVAGTSIEGRSASEVLSDIGASAVAGSSSIVTTGALNSGSITSGFGTIDTGSSAITTTGVGTFGSLDISGDIDVDGTTNLDVVDIDGAVDMASTLTVGGLTTLNGKFLIDGSNNDLMTFRTTGDTASQVLGLQFQNNSEAVTAQIFGTGDNSSSGVFRIKGIGDVAIIGGEIGVDGNAGDLVVKSGGDVHVGTGDLVFATAGKGIVLGATSNTDANTLDDYEEGTWSPTIRGESGTEPTQGTHTAKYVKVGQLVHIEARMVINTDNGGSGLEVAGLPFVTDNAVIFHLAETAVFGVVGIMFSNGSVASGSGHVTFREGNGSSAWQSGTYVQRDNGQYTMVGTYRTTS